MTGHRTKIPRGYQIKDGKLVKTNKHKNIVQRIQERKSKKIKPVRGTRCAIQSAGGK